jgi:hypothetical protein
MSHVAIIVGVSGNERYLSREYHAAHPRAAAGVTETTERRRAKPFRSENSAQAAADLHLKSFAPHIQRAMAYRVEAA